MVGQVQLPSSTKGADQFTAVSAVAFVCAMEPQSWSIAFSKHQDL